MTLNENEQRLIQNLVDLIKNCKPKEDDTFPMYDKLILEETENLCDATKNKIRLLLRYKHDG